MQTSIYRGEIVCNGDRSQEPPALLDNGEIPLFPAVVDLKTLWLTLTSGACFVLDSHYSDQQCFLVVERRRQPLDRRLAETRVALLERILLGQSQKSVAIDFRLAISTVALACSDCLRIMGRNHLSSRVPALLVMATHAAHGVVLPPARAQRVSKGRTEHWVLAARRPDLKLTGDLTQAEEAVTRLLVEGHPHARIAELREASPRTVANQLASAFRKLGISGRGELLAMLIRGMARALPVSAARASGPSQSARRPVRHRPAPRRAPLSVLSSEQHGG